MVLRSVSDLENYIISVERMKEYADVATEVRRRKPYAVTLTYIRNTNTRPH